MPEWTIQKLLNWVTEYFTTKGVDSARLSSEMLIGHVLGLKRIELYTHFADVVSDDNLAGLHELVKRASEKEPVAYLIGKTEFYSIEFKVTPATLIPRPETELLVERGIDFLRKRDGKQFVCDLCTGSGCVAVAIGANFSNSEITATDISEKALEIAADNIAKHGLKGQIHLLQGDLFALLRLEKPEIKFDLIVSNPPYVSSEEYESLDENVKNYEPKQALWAGQDGLDVYRKIISESPMWLKPKAALMLEIGLSQGNAVKKLLMESGSFSEITIEKDFNNNDRIATALAK